MSGFLDTAPLSLATLVMAMGSAAWAQETPGDFREWSFATDEDGIPVRTADVPGTSARRRLENVGYGPLRLTSQSPFQSLRLEVAADAPSSLARGHWELRQTTAWSKMWAQRDDYVLNYEMLSTTHSVLYGITDALQIEVGAVENTRFGGSMDGFIRSFHDAFGIQQSGRGDYPRGTFVFHMKDPAGGTISLQEDRAEATAEYIFVTLHQTLTEGTELVPAVAVSFTLKSNLHDSPDVSGGPVEVAGSLSASKRFGDFYGYLSVGLSRSGDDRFYGLEMRSYAVSFQAAVEWNVVQDFSAVVQLLRSSGAMVNYGPLSQASYELSVGIKVEATRGMVFELGVIENLVVFDNSPDFGLHCGLTMQF